MFCRSLFVLFLLAIMLSVLLRYTDSDYPFGIFKLFLRYILWNIFPILVLTLFCKSLVLSDLMLIGFIFSLFLFYLSRLLVVVPSYQYFNLKVYLNSYH